MTPYSHRTEMEISVVQRTPRRQERPASIHAHWWQPGVYASIPAVALWIIARLPTDTLAGVFGTTAAPLWFNHAGDTIFVAGWLASAAWLWIGRRRPEPPAQPDPGQAAARHSHTRHRHRAG